MVVMKAMKCSGVHKSKNVIVIVALNPVKLLSIDEVGSGTDLSYMTVINHLAFCTSCHDVLADPCRLDNLMYWGVAHLSSCDTVGTGCEIGATVAILHVQCRLLSSLHGQVITLGAVHQRGVVAQRAGHRTCDGDSTGRKFASLSDHAAQQLYASC